MKHLTPLLILLLSQFSIAAADTSLPDKPSTQSPEILPNVLLEAAERGESKVREASSAMRNPNTVQAPITDGVKKAREDVDSVLLSLVDEVNALKSKVVITAHTVRSTQTPKERKSIGSKTVYNFQEGAIYEVHAGVDRVTDIELGSGEYLTNPPVSGDTVRWKISVLESERNSSKSTHVIVKPIEEDIETNLILTTNKNVYHLRLKASDWYMPSISWNYPEEEARALEQTKLKRRQEERVGVAPEKLNFNYEVTGKSFPWRPSQVFDDGQKTYIKMPSDLSATEAPALFILDNDNEPMLVNYRKKGDFYILDRLILRAQMRVGKKDRIDIRSDKDERTFFERLF